MSSTWQKVKSFLRLETDSSHAVSTTQHIVTQENQQADLSRKRSRSHDEDDHHPSKRPAHLTNAEDDLIHRTSRDDLVNPAQATFKHATDPAEREEQLTKLEGGATRERRQPAHLTNAEDDLIHRASRDNHIDLAQATFEHASDAAERVKQLNKPQAGVTRERRHLSRRLKHELVEHWLQEQKVGKLEWQVKKEREQKLKIKDAYKTTGQTVRQLESQVEQLQEDFAKKEEELHSQIRTLSTEKNDLVNAREQVEKELECDICYLTLSVPHVIACGHVFCKRCLESWKKRTDIRLRMCCPKCRAEIPLDDNDSPILSAIPVLNAIMGHLQLDPERPADSDDEDDLRSEATPSTLRTSIDEIDEFDEFDEFDEDDNAGMVD